MKNSEVNDPLKDTKDEAKEKETKHKEAPIEEQKIELADQIESSVSDAKPGTEESVVEASEPVANEAVASESEPVAAEPDSSEPDSSEPDPGPEQKDTAPAVKPVPQTKKSAPEVLIDESEEQQKNDSYDDDVDLDDQEHKEEEVNYALLSKEDLVKMMREKLDNPGKGNIRKEVEDIGNNGVTRDELVRVKEQLKGNLILGMESTTSRMTIMGKNRLLKGFVEEQDELIAKIDAISLGDVRDTVVDVMNWNKAAFSFLSSANI